MAMRWLLGGLNAVLAVVLIQSGTVWAKPDEARMLIPISPWHVDWAKSSCGLRRVFGEPDKPILLQLEQFEPGSAFQLTLTGSGIDKWPWEEQLAVKYGQAGAYYHPYYRYGLANDGRTQTILITSTQLTGGPLGNQPPVPSTPEIESAITHISFRQGAREFSLATGSLGRPFVELRRCTEQLVASWGFDPAVQLKRSRAPVPIDPGTWLKGSYYPRQAINSGAESVINFRLAVDQQGMPTACEVQSAYSGEHFEQRTCEALMKRARFEPALDAAGKPIGSYYVSRAGWLFGRP